jgi:hypothetical protein
MKPQNIRTISLVVVTLTYLIIGGAVFDYLESAHEVVENNRLIKIIDAFKKKHKMSDDEFHKVYLIETGLR